MDRLDCRESLRSVLLQIDHHHENVKRAFREAVAAGGDREDHVQKWYNSNVEMLH